MRERRREKDKRHFARRTLSPSMRKKRKKKEDKRHFARRTRWSMRKKAQGKRIQTQFRNTKRITKVNRTIYSYKSYSLLSHSAGRKLSVVLPAAICSLQSKVSASRLQSPQIKSAPKKHIKTPSKRCPCTYLAVVSAVPNPATASYDYFCALATVVKCQLRRTTEVNNTQIKPFHSSP